MKTFIPTIDTDVPWPDPLPLRRLSQEEHHARFQKYLEAAANSVTFLVPYGLKMEATPDQLNMAASLAIAYAKDPMGTSKKVNTPQKITQMPPAAVREAHRILTTFGHNVVQDALQVRHMVTNKLIEESENPDPRVRLKALELLGKISDVGLFSDKTEVTVTHTTSDELREKLRDKLSRLVDVTPAGTPATEDASFEDAEIVDQDPVHILDTSLWDEET